MTEEIGIARLRGLVRRRKKTVVFTFVPALASGLFLVFTVPASFQARTVLRIDDPKPSRDYVTPTVNEPSIERLKSRRVTFLARPLIIEAATRAHLLPPEGHKDREPNIEAIASRLDAKLEGEDTFVLTFTSPDPGQAKALLEHLASAYTSWHTKEMAERASAAADFFGREVAALRPRVTEAEATVESFRLSRYGSLPDQLDANLRLMDEVERGIHSQTASLDNALSRRSELIAEAASPLRRQEEDVAGVLSVARAKYSPNAPDVKNLESELARVRAERRADEANLARQVLHGAELRSVSGEISQARNFIGELRGRESELRRRIDQAAKNGEALARLSVDRDVLRDRLKTLVAKHEESVLAAGLEVAVAAKTRITVVEPAWVTSRPVKPSRPLLATLALLAALALALLVAFVVETTDQRIRALEDVRLIAGELPILGIVPSLPDRHRLALPERAIRSVE